MYSCVQSSSRDLYAESNPPGIKTIVIVLAEDLAVPELEENGEVGPHLRIRRQSIDRNSEESAPQNLERDILAVDDRVHDLELLRANPLLSLSRRRKNCREVAVDSNR